MPTPSAAQPELSIVIPVYNEEELLESAAAELCAGLDTRGWDYELIFAENGSCDCTQDILQRLSTAHPRIHWFHSERPNYGTALKQGILRARGRWVMCDEIDLGDLSFYDAALSLLRSGEAEMVVGSKAAKGARDARPLLRRLATRAHNRLLRMALGFQGTDTHGLKIFHRTALLKVVESCVVDMDVFASELVIRAWRQGLRVTEIPIQLAEKRQPSIHLFKRIPNVLKNVAKLVYVVRLGGG